MKKQLLHLGKALNKAEQKSINGGATSMCEFYAGPYGGTCSACCKLVSEGVCEPDPTQICMP